MQNQFIEFMPVKVILADDHPAVRQGIRNILEKESDIEIVGEFKNGRELLHSGLIESSDVLLLDLNMEKIDGLKVLDELQEKKSPIKIIVISAYDSPKLMAECLEKGASGYILKTGQLSDVVETIHRVIQGENTFLDFDTKEIPSNKFSYFDNFLSKYKLTTREVEIIKMVCEGMTSTEIADKLSLSTFTVQTHRKNIFKKLKLDNSNTATLYEFAFRNGIIQ